MGHQVLCRKCGTVLGTVASDTVGGHLHDLRMPMFTQLCDYCAEIVESEFQRRLARATGGYTPTDPLGQERLRDFEARAREEARPAFNYDIGEPVCDRCDRVGQVNSNGLCGSCAQDDAREEASRRVELDRARRNSRDTDFTNL